jgi:UDPglucose--hexose-1-phosphate uridylyltransferase
VSQRIAADAMPEFRRDPITGRWVIIASGRASRPWHIGATRASSGPCPFCAGNEAMTPPEVWAQRDPKTNANAPGWRLRIVPNKYPALENSGAWSAKGDGFYQSMNGLGVHEVIIESPDHVTRMSALSAQQFADISRAYRARLRALGNDSRWRYLMIYKNQGERAGATLEHVHSQLTALPTVPKEMIDEIDGANKHFAATGRCIYCEVSRQTIESGERLVADSERFVALCPFAPRFGYETWILPKNHAAAFTESSDEDMTAFGQILRGVLLKLDRCLDHPPFNYFIHSAPPDNAANPHYHWHMEILPQLTRAAGFEWGSGVHMNSVAPEDAARLLRDQPI